MSYDKQKNGVGCLGIIALGLSIASLPAYAVFGHYKKSEECGVFESDKSCLNRQLNECGLPQTDYENDIFEKYKDKHLACAQNFAPSTQVIPSTNQFGRITVLCGWHKVGFNGLIVGNCTARG